ncbi:MAG: EFR1 family ferrodoxin, partial [Promethearchaeota archaeon]
MPGTDGLAMMDENSSYIKKAINRDYDNVPKIEIFADKIANIINRLENGEKIINLEKRPPLKIIDSVLGWVFRGLYIVLVKYIKKRYWVDGNCNRCSLCVKICPVQNITLNEDGIHFANNCTVCLRCIHQCPQEAIQLGGFTQGKFRWHGPKGEFNPLKILKK